MTSAASFPPASPVLQLAELKRERKMRAGVYEHWISTGKMKRAVAEYQNNALDGAIKTLEAIVAAQGQPGRKELIALLRRAPEFLRRADLTDAEMLANEIEKTLAKVPE